MIEILAFFPVFIVGFIFSRIAGLKGGYMEYVALSWLIGSYLVTTFLFTYYWVGFLSVAFALIFLFFVRMVCREGKAPPDRQAAEAISCEGPFREKSKIYLLAWFLIGTQIFYALMCNMWLDTQYWDSFDFWHLRAKYFFYQGGLGLDDDPSWVLGGSKGKHYPYHMPLLKAFLCRVNGSWSESLALNVDILNVIAFMTIAYKWLKQVAGQGWAVMAVYIVSSLPLVGIHMSAGYSDLAVGLYLASSAIYLDRFRKMGKNRYLAVAALFIACAAWTKNDAMVLYFPIVCLACLLVGKWGGVRVFFVAGVLPLLPWLVFKQAMGFAFSQNPEGAAFVFHVDAIILLAKYMFSYFSFGILWVAFLPLLFVRCKANLSYIFWPLSLVCIAGIFSVYMFTESFRYLENGMTIHRSLLQVSPLLAVAMVTRIVDAAGFAEKLLEEG